MSIFEDVSHLSKIAGCGGKRDEKPESFVVEEIFDGKLVTELEEKDEDGEYINIVLKKKNYTTYSALKILASKLNISFDRFSVAGQKDKNAITYQLVSCWVGKNLTCKDFMDLDINSKGIEILKCWRSAKGVKIGNLTGNKFSINLTDVDDINRIYHIMDENNYLIPNYFGPQRFGINENNVNVAKYLLKKDYEHAIKYLFKIEEDQDLEDIDVKQIGEYERKILKFIKENGGEKENYKKAIKLIPKQIMKLIIESYQSYLFNYEISERIKKKQLLLENDKTCGFNCFGFIDGESKGEIPCIEIVGYNTIPNDIVKDLLWKDGIEIGDFKMRDFPELACKGSFRPLFVNVKDLNIKINNDKEYNVSFSLPKGAYATAALREMMDIKRI